MVNIHTHQTALERIFAFGDFVEVVGEVEGAAAGVVAELNDQRWPNLQNELGVDPQIGWELARRGEEW